LCYYKNEINLYRAVYFDDSEALKRRLLAAFSLSTTMFMHIMHLYLQRIHNDSVNVNIKINIVRVSC